MLKENYLELHNNNEGLTDKVGTSNRKSGKVIERIIGYIKQIKYFDNWGSNNTIRRGVRILKTEGAILNIGNNCVIDENYR
mgnify:FL=1